MPNAITVLWRTCVKFTKLQNLIFFFSYIFSSFSHYMLSVVHFLPSLSSFLHLRSVPLFELPTPPSSVRFSYFYSFCVPTEVMTTDFSGSKDSILCREVCSAATMAGEPAWLTGAAVSWTAQSTKKLEPTRKGAVLTTVQAISAALRDVTPSRSVIVVNCFETTYYLHLQGLILDPPTFETGGISFFRNVRETLPECHIFTSNKKWILVFFCGFTWFLNTTDGIINSTAFLIQFSSMDKPKIAVFCDTPPWSLEYN
jgi:hypothetical protein